VLVVSTEKKAKSNKKKRYHQIHKIYDPDEELTAIQDTQNPTTKEEKILGYFVDHNWKKGTEVNYREMFQGKRKINIR